MAAILSSVLFSFESPDALFSMNLLGVASGFIPPLAEILSSEVHDECGTYTRQPPHDLRDEGDRDDGLVLFHSLENHPGTTFG